MTRIVKPESLHLQAYHILKEEIVKGEYKPYERVVEARLAKKLGISRGPVREAIRMLIQDGLLTYNDGYVRVYKPTVKDVVDIFQCRESLEALAIRLAIEHITEAEEEQLQKNLHDTIKAYERDKVIELGQLDQQFHDIIIHASKNSQLLALLEAIRTKIHYMRISMVKGDFYPSFVKEHERLIELLLKGNEDDAIALMKQHINKGLEGVLMHINHQ
ncbi:MAG: GntR family transcriptional regulator [Bacillota bacterium]|uniref:GntR family transcriptional regulator n=1 Tax=Virgibacillus salarius TaxID=447199 RepID=A0A941I7P3_9BACI|nr:MULTISPECIES: GntR family transcriptional regulator [Bacillaceae]NAZ07454.1 FCD domain-containing protein [Agaribacter marinus]MBR7794734.1 GntR family transcriptional regulator [Virgibacillus salarius]MCC2249588.1 GntR family transcriptional regulator [Virgibacillus sp. AGTR]MDY7044532.1 GntR family transcriptional regulator [Virgibacillus sp. M23]QRZ19331.1 GntR family transcriptional regulator [Virgibacillus sp. AGTR]